MFNGSNIDYVFMNDPRTIPKNLKLSFTMIKPMILYRKLWKFGQLWKKNWYYTQNYGTFI